MIRFGKSPRRLGSLLRWRLQKLERFAENWIFRRKRTRPGRGLLCRGSCRGILVADVGIVLSHCADHFGGLDAFFKNRLAVRLVIVRYRQKQRRTIVQRDEFLVRCLTKGALTDDIAAMIRNDRRRQHFRGARGTGVGQYGNGILPNDFAGLSRGNLGGNGLSAQRRNCAGRDEQSPYGNGFRNRSAAALAQIQDEFV
jgi:hypothetical protein